MYYCIMYDGGVEMFTNKARAEQAMKFFQAHHLAPRLVVVPEKDIDEWSRQ